jgi:hypothetical protein
MNIDTAAAQPRRFAAGAPPDVQTSFATRANQRFEPLPRPTGAYPYRVDLAEVVGEDMVASARHAGRLSFHLTGDTGGVKNPVPQHIVAVQMSSDFSNGAAERPMFFYHLGDVVYYYGATSEYYSQFYEPYEHYPAPVLAIPGNHDGDVDPQGGSQPSLAAFVRNFCATHPHRTPEAGDTHRDAMTLPNVYWSLVTPFATIVGLYTNVPDGGVVDDDQAAWLQAELAAAPQDAAVIVAMHHPIFSASAHHSGSSDLGQVLDAAIAGAGRAPDLVVCGHVHNYQRFTRVHEGRQIPYVVAGAGGYWHLHSVKVDGKHPPQPWPVPGRDLTLERYCTKRHGFLRLTAAPGQLHGQYVTVPRPHESWEDGPVEVFDSFVVDVARHTVASQSDGASPAKSEPERPAAIPALAASPTLPQSNGAHDR